MNRLADETSPYLLQHRDNPVHWWPWGRPALDEARRTGKPILLSVGYSACHWCHVMAHESFEDEATAALMNELFVNIKVDREERPDIDHIYMSALHALGERGGWPLTMFLTPEGEPFWGGTYFPKTARFGRPSFQSVLREVARIFRDEPQRVGESAGGLRTALAEKPAGDSGTRLGRAELDRLAARILDLFDPIHGGLRGAPKFPQVPILELLWRAGERTREPRFFAAVETTLARMCQGGICDHLGGGFARYSTDERWHVPHFEKMLSDNAQLLPLLALAHARSGESLFRDRARELVGWLAREMTTPEGAFASSLDADTDGEEGRFYSWSLTEIVESLGPADGGFFANAYHVEPDGNWEETNVLHRLDSTPLTASEEERLARLRARLLRIRDSRPRPGLDDKILADWNGLTIAALANAGALLDEPGWIDMAARAFDAVSRLMTSGDRLGHSWREGRLLFPGLSTDLAAMTKAALAMHQASGTDSYLVAARGWHDALDRHHATPDGRWFLTADDADALIVRPAPGEDDATPNPQGLVAQNLLRLAVLTGDEAQRARADRLFDAMLPAASANLFAHATVLNALDLRLGAVEIVCAGPTAERFLVAARRLPTVNHVLLFAPSADALPERHPAREAARAAGDGAAFVCVGERCSLPISDPERIASTIAAMRF